MRFIKELLILVKILFSTKKPNKITSLEPIKMVHFPPKGFLFCMWCGKLLYRAEKSSFVEGNSPKLKIMLHHEQIHLDQANKMGGFFKYYLSYFWNWIKGWSFLKGGAYYTNKYEVEAFANEENLNYVGCIDKKYELKQKRLLYRRHKRNWKTWLKSYYY